MCIFYLEVIEIMVKVLANGDIVADDDSRAGGNQAAAADNRPRQGFVNHNNQAGAGQYGQPANPFDAINQRLTAAGFPTWQAGPYPVRPIVSLGFLLSLILGGVRGLLFSGVLFLIVNYSQSGWSGWSGGARASGTSAAASGGATLGRGAPGGGSSSGSSWPRGGHTLGRS